MHHERRCGHLGQQRGHVDITLRYKVADGIFWRC
jgi:hypothetical protein